MPTLAIAEPAADRRQVLELQDDAVTTLSLESRTKLHSVPGLLEWTDIDAVVDPSGAQV
jgi:hypothetical protein